jgi:biotin operon repressor
MRWYPIALVRTKFSRKKFFIKSLHYEDQNGIPFGPLDPNAVFLHSSSLVSLINNGVKMNYSVYFNALSKYSESWNLSEIVLFERLLLLQRKAGQTVPLNKAKLCASLHIKRHALNAAITKLHDLGIISQKGPGAKNVQVVQINPEKIIENVEQIYNFSSLTSLDRKEAISKRIEALKKEMLLTKVDLGSKI